MKYLRYVPWAFLGGVTVMALSVWILASMRVLPPDPEGMGIAFIIGVVLGGGGAVIDFIRWEWL